MSRLLKFVLAASMALLCWSCDKNGQNPEEPEKEPSEFYEFPLNSAENSFEAAANGVSVEITDISEDNVVFNLVPGEGIKSYRMLLYPKALLYNYLLNENCVDESEETCEDVQGV